MAELIPLHYRAKFVVRQRVRLWTLGGVVTLAMCAAAVVAAAVWSHAAAGEVARLDADYRQKATLIQASEQLQARRQALADRMRKIEGLKQDKTLLSLLRNVAAGFSELDCLEYIHVDARGTTKGTDAAALAAAATDSDTSHYIVRLSGITSTPATLADLMTRMGQGNNPPMQVQLEASKREGFLDGQVIRFQMACEKPKDKT